jgi:hypothetical protein
VTVPDTSDMGAQSGCKCLLELLFPGSSARYAAPDDHFRCFSRIGPILTETPAWTRTRDNEFIRPVSPKRFRHESAVRANSRLAIHPRSSQRSEYNSLV